MENPEMGIKNFRSKAPLRSPFSLYLYRMLLGKDIAKAKVLLEEGNVVAVPTETVYGLAANALNPKAVSKIFTVKGRPDFDPLIVHAASKEAAFAWARSIPPEAIGLADAFWPGPLTLVLPKKEAIPPEVTSGLDTLGLRVPNHPMLRALLELLEFPLAAPSANPFGYISPTSAEHVSDQLGSSIPYILDGGVCTIGLESTIIGFEREKAVLLRPGHISKEAIAGVIGYLPQRVESPAEKPAAPGMLSSHYSPKTPMEWLDEGIIPAANEGALYFSHRPAAANYAYETLSERCDLMEAARRLYACMRNLDKLGLKKIWVEKIPMDLVNSEALTDRLSRAVGKPPFSP